MSHSDNEEQVLEIKDFFAKTWKIIVAVIVIGLLAIWGWRYWQSYKTEQLTNASDKYELLISKLDPNEPTSVDGLVAFAKENDTIYSVFANLQAAKYYVEDLKDYAGAKALLIDASKKTDSEPVLATINIRIARLEYQLGEYAAGLQTLAKVTNTNWAATVNDIRGDILVKMAEYAQACDAYQLALDSKPIPELEKNIKMKLNQAEYLKATQILEQEKQAKEQAEKAAENNSAETSAP